MSEDIQMWEQAVGIVYSKHVDELLFSQATQLSPLDVLVADDFQVPEFKLIARPLKPLLNVSLGPSLRICAKLERNGHQVIN